MVEVEVEVEVAVEAVRIVEEKVGVFFSFVLAGFVHFVAIVVKVSFVVEKEGEREKGAWEKI